MNCIHDIINFDDSSERNVERSGSTSNRSSRLRALLMDEIIPKVLRKIQNFLQVPKSCEQIIRYVCGRYGGDHPNFQFLLRNGIAN